MQNRRTVLVNGTVGAAFAALGILPAVGASNDAARARVPWIRRMAHMYTGPNGESRIREIAVPAPDAVDSQWLLRRPAERVTVGAMAPGFTMDFHVANQPNILIPLFGTLVVKLKDGSVWTFSHGEILFAEDCIGGGHISGAGADGCCSVSIQVPKTPHCLENSKEPADILLGRGRPSL